jgi:hypothetical protein
MIFTEHGLHFAKKGDYWRCVEWPELVMLRGRGDTAGYWQRNVASACASDLNGTMSF